MKESPLERRCRNVLYSIYDECLEEEKKKVFDEIKGTEPYLNQILEDVIHFINYDLPLRPIILERIRGDKNVSS